MTSGSNCEGTFYLLSVFFSKGIYESYQFLFKSDLWKKYFVEVHNKVFWYVIPFCNDLDFSLKCELLFF